MNQKITDAMLAIVEAPGYHFLVSDKKDLHKYDLPIIENQLEDGGRFLWVLSRDRSDITRIGVHPRRNSWATASINVGLKSSSIGIDTYLVTTKGVKKLTEKQARDAIEVTQYRIGPDRVVRNANGLPIANIEVQKRKEPGNAANFFSVQFNSLTSLSRNDVLALQEIAMGEGVEAWNDLFVCAEEVTVDGTPIQELIAIKPAFELNVERQRG